MVPATLSVIHLLQALSIWQSAEERNEIQNKMHNFLPWKPGLCALSGKFHRAECRAVSSGALHWRTVCCNIQQQCWAGNNLPQVPSREGKTSPVLQQSSEALARGVIGIFKVFHKGKVSTFSCLPSFPRYLVMENISKNKNLATKSRKAKHLCRIWADL